MGTVPAYQDALGVSMSRDLLDIKVLAGVELNGGEED